MTQFSATSAGASSSALSVSAALALAKGALEGVTVRMIGEVSEVSNKPGYKAVYFTVKDKSASLPCMMWNNRYNASGMQLRVGMLVELTGRFTLYAAKGRMNFDVFSVALAGEGNLRMQVANLAKKLQAEGLMDPSRKRPLPAFAQTIGLVTSPRGAAVHDVLRTLRRRYPLARVILAGVAVEGTRAPQYLIDGLNAVVSAGAEVVLVVRGGGSFEDLMPFNDEALARAISACPVPVVTGIGHEPDTSIADMVADVRASTPTAAAEAVAPDVLGVCDRLDGLGQSLALRMQGALERQKMQLDRLAEKELFTQPMALLAEQTQTLEDLAARLPLAIPRSLERDSVVIGQCANRLMSVAPHIAAHARRDVASAQTRMRYQGEVLLSRFEAQVGVQAARLHDLSPLSVMARGFSITRDAQGSVVKSVERLAPGDVVTVTVSDGELLCDITQVDKMVATVETMEE